MSAEKFIASSVRLAHEDLAAARLLVAAQNHYAAYHLEQAAEKVTRAVLTSEGLSAGYSHNLTQFVDMVPDENPIKPLLRKVETLGAYATGYRYPTSYGTIPKTPTPEKLEEFVLGVDALVAFAARGFGVDLAHPSSPAASSAPFR